MFQTLEDPNKSKHADPAMVSQIIQSIGVAVHAAVIPDVTTQADILSAFFTVLHRILRTSQQMESVEEHAVNSREIGKILSSMLLEFGTSGIVH